MNAADILKRFGARVPAGEHVVRSPIDGAEMARIAYDDARSIDAKIKASVDAFHAWRTVPAPRRGELMRLLGEELRAEKETLGLLVTLEAGKILQEGLGEVQEMIDICDFAVGLSRQLYGLVIASERPAHKMTETWHPAGPVGVISAFNFPVAVWAWNASLGFVCGDSVIWKPSEKTPLTALAVEALFQRAARKFGDAPAGVMQVVLGLREAGEAIAKDPRIPIVSATGSTRMGRALGPVVAGRFGRSILELGGNNAMIVAPSADLDLAVRAITFSAVGTAGQRCTSLRRLIAHESVKDKIVERLKGVYEKLSIGDPREKGTLIGPLIDEAAFANMEKSIARARAEGGKIFGGGRALANKFPNAYYVNPAIAEMPSQTDVVRDETFAPLLYALSYKKFDDAVAVHNAVPQGLSSCIFTRDLQEAERFVSAVGSDCGIANVNLGPSGAEIGGAFGGEKDTGGGRESGSDAWKGYMRRQTSTINYSDQLPLAQGIKFE